MLGEKEDRKTRNEVPLPEFGEQSFFVNKPIGSKSVLGGIGDFSAGRLR